MCSSSRNIEESPENSCGRERKTSVFLTNTFLTNMDDEEQAEIQGWLEDVLGSPFPMGSTFEDCLASGARLCQVMNRLW